jgi:hypothetical protein
MEKADHHLILAQGGRFRHRISSSRKRLCRSRSIRLIPTYTASILEMWLFKPVFINGFGSRYLQWRDSPEASMLDKIILALKFLLKQIKPVACYVWQLWLTHGLPLVKGLFKKS